MTINGCEWMYIKVYTSLVIMCLLLISASIFIGIMIGAKKINGKIPDDKYFDNISILSVVFIICAANFVVGTLSYVGGVLISNEKCI